MRSVILYCHNIKYCRSRQIFKRREKKRDKIIRIAGLWNNQRFAYCKNFKNVYFD